MSNKMRWRYGDTNPVVAAVDSATVIEIGDLLWQDGDHAKPASSVPIVGTADKVGFQKRFADNFLGVAMERSVDGSTTPIRVATTGVFEFDLTHAIAPFELGDLIGVYAHETDDRLSNQQVTKLADSLCAIARVAKREPITTTSIHIDIRSTADTGSDSYGDPTTSVPFESRRPLPTGLAGMTEPPGRRNTGLGRR